MLSQTDLYLSIPRQYPIYRQARGMKWRVSKKEWSQKEHAIRSQDSFHHRPLGWQVFEETLAEQKIYPGQHGFLSNGIFDQTWDQAGQTKPEAIRPEKNNKTL